MKISYNWLKEFIDIKETPEAIGEVLTQTGLEVEGIERVEKIPGGLQGLVVGEVKTCVPHPNADKLKLTTVDAGGDELLSIVCGAPNVAAGQKVVVAPVGTTLYPAGEEPFKIKKTKIRGELSEGMLCAEDEIGVGKSHEGLLVVDTDKPNGTPVRELFETGEDHIYEIGLTPNRGDAASHLGTARDLKAFYDRPLKVPHAGPVTVRTDNPIEVTVENTEACPRYSGVTIRGITVAPSPDWLQWKLRAIGLSPVNNIVDITNYVMMSIGQPMHAFDADKIRGNKVIVKTLPSGTKFTTLDNEERTLHENDLMICDQKEGMCIAGIFGGIHSGISDETTSIFLESACFSADYIRSSAMRHGLSTDASFRFERGADPDMTIPALHWATHLILDIAGGYPASEYIDIYPEKIRPVKVKTTYRNFDRLIGKKLPKDQITGILNRLDIETEKIDDEAFYATVPPYRSEVTREADLVEEVLRIYGFNNIELEETLTAGSIASFKEKEPYKVFESISGFLAGKGFSEIITNSLTNPLYTEKVPVEAAQPVEIMNKSSEELGYMKTTPLYTALESVRHNINRRQRNVRFFELAKVYSKAESGFREQELLTLYLTGDLHEESWLAPSRAATFHDLSGVVMSLLGFLKIDTFNSQPYTDEKFQYGLEITYNNSPLGKLGKLKKPIGKYFEINQDVFYAEFNWKKLLKAVKPEHEFTSISRFPEVKRDLSLVLSKKVGFNEVKQLAFKTEKKLLNRISVFSVYEGKNIGEDKKAYAISFYLQDKEKTLTDKIIDKVMSSFIHIFEKELGAIIRK